MKERNPIRALSVCMSSSDRYQRDLGTPRDFIHVQNNTGRDMENGSLSPTGTLSTTPLLLYINST